MSGMLFETVSIVQTITITLFVIKKIQQQQQEKKASSFEFQNTCKLVYLQYIIVCVCVTNM